MLRHRTVPENNARIDSGLNIPPQVLPLLYTRCFLCNKAGLQFDNDLKDENSSSGSEKRNY
jgi:hypothetical protein